MDTVTPLTLTRPEAIRDVCRALEEGTRHLQTAAQTWGDQEALRAYLHLRRATRIMADHLEESGVFAEEEVVLQMLTADREAREARLRRWQAEGLAIASAAEVA